MKYIVAYILISFVAIGVLGFSGLMNHESLFSQCVSATIPGGMPCAEVPHGFQMNILHAQIFQSFTFALLVAATLLGVVLLAISIKVMQIQQVTQEFSFEPATNSNSWHKVIRWLVLNQQHPTHA